MCNSNKSFSHDFSFGFIFRAVQEEMTHRFLRTALAKITVFNVTLV